MNQQEDTMKVLLACLSQKPPNKKTKKIVPIVPKDFLYSLRKYGKLLFYTVFFIFYFFLYIVLIIFKLQLK